MNQEQRFAFALTQANKWSHVFLDRFQALDRFVGGGSFLLEESFNPQHEILFRRRLEDGGNQPRPISAKFLLRHPNKREVALYVSVGSGIDVVLQTVVLPVLAGFV